METIQRSGDQLGGDTETGDCVKNGNLQSCMPLIHVCYTAALYPSVISLNVWFKSTVGLWERNLGPLASSKLCCNTW